MINARCESTKFFDAIEVQLNDDAMLDKHKKLNKRWGTFSRLPQRHRNPIFDEAVCTPGDD